MSQILSTVSTLWIQNASIQVSDCHFVLDTHHKTPSINAQCLSMPINADQNHGIDQKCLSMPIIADQCQSIQINSSHCRSMPDQCISKTLVNWSALIAIDWNWSTSGSMPEFWSTLIGIGHWSGESWHKQQAASQNPNKNKRHGERCFLSLLYKWFRTNYKLKHKTVLSLGNLVI